MNMTLSSDPFKFDEADPRKTKAHRSCLWELETLMKNHYDQRVRDFCKLFKTNFMQKTVFYKTEQLLSAEGEGPVDQLIADLKSVEAVKDGKIYSKHLASKYAE
mmetsp:Transcript_118803/g.165527  ORF Transcript_118803/g.165527 Transcript_118803/m.165527 type:complete len:104 (-) Transcript_118803:150-461(-)|eukprot:CAMPEP_0176342648 /NCGR_PEP_ID=MMETSP0126-20121128/3334_1 /TAXON_ID=141414 ORGANISM="Strombidinopsis acuminatum, Strain SPMC142" /NCGR_SAMPLE_ID=MMETSP0126 /ASSEMBLY_ACC=CAM_ASM_000229 /LENGTH=103 /DNA_ID=CAMNT_0017688167 /DNA_START=424 /DNA_END=732 /DNA_ORIENTATION=-